MYSYKRYTSIFLFLCFFIILFNLIIWNIYTKKVFLSDNIVGDLARMSYQLDFIDKRKNVNFLNKKHINYNEWGGEPVDIITIGDSFSNAGAGGRNPYYQDYLSTFFDFHVVNIQPLSFGFIETVLGLKSSGILDKMKPKYIILQSVERSSISRYSKNINFNLKINYEEMNKLLKIKYKFSKPEPNFLTHLNFNAFLYNLFYKYDDNAFYSDVFKAKLSKDFFSTSISNELLFYFEDIKNIEYSNSESIKRLNDNLNELQVILNEYNIKLLFMPSVDKYNLYSKYITNNVYSKSIFFEELRNLNKKYYLIDTKAILSILLEHGKKDIYYSDDTHWSFVASEEIILDLNKNLFKKENIYKDLENLRKQIEEYDLNKSILD